MPCWQYLQGCPGINVVFFDFILFPPARRMNGPASLLGSKRIFPLRDTHQSAKPLVHLTYLALLYKATSAQEHLSIMTFARSINRSYSSGWALKYLRDLWRRLNMWRQSGPVSAMQCLLLYTPQGPLFVICCPFRCLVSRRFSWRSQRKGNLPEERHFHGD